MCQFFQVKEEYYTHLDESVIKECVFLKLISDSLGMKIQKKKEKK